MLRQLNNKVGNRPLSNRPLGGIDYVDIEELVNDGKNVDDIVSLLEAQKIQTKKNYELSDNYMIMEGNKREKLNIFKEAKLLQKAYEDKLINYVAAILDPEFNYNTGIMVKQPSLLNPPSVSIPIKTLTTIKSETQSSICISWNPTMFCTKNDLTKIKLGKKGDKEVVANRISSVLYALPENAGTEQAVPAESWDAKVRSIPDNLPEIGVSKARLVSAKIKISFRGSVLNQGGTIMGAATFQGPPGLVMNTDNTNYVYRNKPDTSGRIVATWGDLFKETLGDQFDDETTSPFDEKILSNGIWAKNVNITKDANGISAVFIPTDPMDEIFYTPGTYYGEKVAYDCRILNDKGATTALTTNKGARLNYLFNIQGLSAANNNPITIETYNTWEVLPTNQSASSLRNSNNQLNDMNSYSKIKDLLQNYFENSSGIHTVREGQLSGLLDYLKAAAQAVWKKFNES